MPDDDWALGQNEVDVRNEARREHQRAKEIGWLFGVANLMDADADQQIELCTNDHKCRAEPDEHDPGCPIEAQLKDDIGF